MKPILSLLALLVLLAAGPVSTQVRLSFFNVERESNNLLIAWQAEVESGVKTYELYRSSPSSNNVLLKVETFTAHGTGKPYRFVDDQVYKAETALVDYRLFAVFDGGMRQEVAAKSVNYTSTAVRRTWGSIKAMFQ